MSQGQVKKQSEILGSFKTTIFCARFLSIAKNGAGNVNSENDVKYNLKIVKHSHELDFTVVEELKRRKLDPRCIVSDLALRFLILVMKNLYLQKTNKEMACQIKIDQEKKAYY